MSTSLREWDSRSLMILVKLTSNYFRFCATTKQRWELFCRININQGKMRKADLNIAKKTNSYNSFIQNQVCFSNPVLNISMLIGMCENSLFERVSFLAIASFRPLQWGINYCPLEIHKCLYTNKKSAELWYENTKTAVPALKTLLTLCYQTNVHFNKSYFT